MYHAERMRSERDDPDTAVKLSSAVLQLKLASIFMVDMESLPSARCCLTGLAKLLVLEAQLVDNLRGNALKLVEDEANRTRSA
mmetsp:Transcript_18552/g.35271  ORF Transcript_18552/g.35271 Transcript_18552/m.35271 type:complete len:83 (+) Transcript_18552:205-453(+)